MLVPALLIAIPVHEMGHAAAAYLLGDRSVRYFGYFTWNPRRFLDPLGVIAVFIALIGWGRKVPVQPNRISTMGQKVLYELGGPAANLLAATRYDKIVEALGGYGEHVIEPKDIRPALERARASGKPACINVVVDPAVFSSGTMNQTMYK